MRGQWRQETRFVVLYCRKNSLVAEMTSLKAGCMCKSCKQSINDEETFVTCSGICNENFHIKCANIIKLESKIFIPNQHFRFVCVDCDKLPIHVLNQSASVNILQQIVAISAIYYLNLVTDLVNNFKEIFNEYTLNKILNPSTIRTDVEVKSLSMELTCARIDPESPRENEVIARLPNSEQIGVCFSCGFYCFASSIESELSNLTYNKIEKNKDLLSKLSPEYWQTMGSLLGCLISGISLCYLGRRTSLQRVAVPVLVLAYSVTFLSINFKKSSSWFMLTMASGIVIQRISQSLSMIIPTIYILETVCWHPGSYKSKAVAILLGLTHVPSAIASLLTGIGLIRLDLDSAVLMFVLLAITLAMLKQSTESPRWLIQSKHKVGKASKAMKSLWPGKSVKHEIDKEIDNMQREMQGTISICTPNSYIRPLLVSSCFLLLTQLVGYEAFYFYSDWTFKLVDLPTDPGIVTPSIRLAVMCMVLLLSVLFPGPKCTSIILLVSTPILMLCLLTFGVFTYALEQGNIQINEYILLPIILLITYQVAFWWGVGTLTIPICTLIMPSKSRPIILTIGVIIYQIASYFCDIFSPLMLNVLHPYGLFWFYGFLTGVTLIYISFVIIPELKYTGSCIQNEETVDIIL